MYNGIGLRTVRGSGTNGYVQRNLSHVDASRTRQTLARSQRNGGNGGFGSDAKARHAPANPDILLHERKRRVEVALMELTLEMEARGCDEDEILDKVGRERERLLALASRDADSARGRRDSDRDGGSSHARQRRKEEENARMKDAFGIASDHVPGESFDPEMQERRRQERIAKREQERAERETQRQQRVKEREERQKEAERRDRDWSNARLATTARRSRSRSPVGGDRRGGRRTSRSRSTGRKASGSDKPSARRRSPSRSQARRNASRSRRSPEPKSSRRGRERKRRSASSSSGSSSSDSGSSPSRSRSRGKSTKPRSRRRDKSHSRSRSESSRSASRTPRRRADESSARKRASPPRESEKKAVPKVLDLSKPTAGVMPSRKLEEEKSKPRGADDRQAKAEAVREKLERLNAKEPGSSPKPSPSHTSSTEATRPSDAAPKKARQTSRWSARKPPAAVEPPAPEPSVPEPPTPTKDEPGDQAPPSKLERDSSQPESPSPPRALALSFALALALSFVLAVVAVGVVVVVALSLSLSLSLSLFVALEVALSPARLSQSPPQPELEPQSEPASDDDREPFLLPASTSDGGSQRLAALRRMPRELLRRAPLLCALCSVSSGVTWVVKGFFVCVGMMLVGGVGSFTLHQMMSPQIDALLQQRSALQKELDALQLQVENLTSVAESRLETIHLLEKELERQALEAAAFAHSGPASAGRLRNGHRLPGGAGLPLPTIVYAGVLGSIILAIVVYRVYRIVQIEVRDHKNALRSRSNSGGGASSGLQHSSPHHSHHHHSHHHPSHRHRRDSSASQLLPAHSPSLSIGVHGDLSAASSSTHHAASSSNSSAALQSPSHLESDVPSPQQCYKRSQPPASPASHLMHVSVVCESLRVKTVPNDFSKQTVAQLLHQWSARGKRMLGLATVHPAPRRALKRVVKSRGERTGGGGLRDASAVENLSESDSRGATATVKRDTVRVRTESDADGEDSEADSNYEFKDGDEQDSDEEEEDSVEHRLALQAELDECSDEGRQDFYLNHMLAERARLEGDDAAWVDRYVELQQQWKERHAYSIDDFDLDTRLASRLRTENATLRADRSQKTAKRVKRTKGDNHRTKRPVKKKPRREYSRLARAFWRFWYLRVAPRLPLELQEERAEYVVTLLALLAFIALSLVIQVLAALRDV
ncbi:hypothetical protein PybrP1_004221 [[Pythium] brassicae (nom. inval.)]|nr:hypothetical protein PybrP1_004221 [[Pythium] brassicae (nom. inval.)]